MKKSRILVTIFSVLLLVGITTGVYAYKERAVLGADQIFQIANIIKENRNAAKEDKVIAKANGLDIYKDEVELYKKLYLLDGTIKDDSYKEVINKRAKLKVLYNMSEENGLAITLDEAKKIALNERAMNEENLDVKGKEFLNKYIGALGLSEDQYWTEYYPKQVQLYVSIEKFKNSLVDEAVEEGKLPALKKDEKSIPQDIEIKKEYKRYIDEKVKNIEESIDIEILDAIYNN